MMPNNAALALRHLALRGPMPGPLRPRRMNGARLALGAGGWRTLARLARRRKSSLAVSPALHRAPGSSKSCDPHPGATPFVPAPTRKQLRDHFVMTMVPMIGFGFMDNTLMIQAGNAIDCTLGVTFGMSTLSAAAVGQIVSGAGSVLFGGTLEQMFRAAGLPSAGFSSAQRSLPLVRKASLMGNFVGVIVGCTLGLVNLLFIDTERSAELKLQALTDEQGFAFEVEASNRERDDATILKVRGPDVDGLLASMTAALTASGCSLIELHASPRDGGCYGTGCMIEDVFVVRPRGGGPQKRQIDDDDLDGLARTLLAASKDPLSAHSLKAQVKDLNEEKEELADRVRQLERAIEDRQITVAPGAKDDIVTKTSLPIRFNE